MEIPRKSVVGEAVATGRMAQEQQEPTADQFSPSFAPIPERPLYEANSDTAGTRQGAWQMAPTRFLDRLRRLYSTKEPGMIYRRPCSYIRANCKPSPAV
jgi:hypothetical protein